MVCGHCGEKQKIVEDEEMGGFILRDFFMHPKRKGRTVTHIL